MRTRRLHIQVQEVSRFTCGPLASPTPSWVLLVFCFEGTLAAVAASNWQRRQGGCAHVCGVIALLGRAAAVINFLSVTVHLLSTFQQVAGTELGAVQNKPPSWKEPGHVCAKDVLGNSPRREISEGLAA